MPRFHRVPPPLVLPSFFSLHPYARFFRRGNPREEGMVSYSFDFVRVVSRICFAGYSSEFSPVSARFLFHRYDTIFLPTGNRPPLFLPSIRAYERATRSRLFPRNSVSRSVRFVRWWETERERGRERYKLYTLFAERFPDRFVSWRTRGRGTNDTSREGVGEGERELIFARVVFLLRGSKGFRDYSTG